jgi:hypothetical protein
VGPNPLNIGVLIGVTAQMLKRFLELFERRAFVIDAERRFAPMRRDAGKSGSPRRFSRAGPHSLPSAAAVANTPQNVAARLIQSRELSGRR